MSIDIDWLELSADGSLNEFLRTFLDNQLKSISLPSYIDNLSVANFSLGSTPPEMTIRHIGNPFDEFYEEEDQEKENANVANSAYHTKNELSDSEEDEDSYSDTDDDKDITMTNTSLAMKTSHLDSFLAVNKDSSIPGNELVESLEKPYTPIRSLMDSNNFIPSRNYNMNNVGLRSLNGAGRGGGTESPTTILKQNHYASLKRDPNYTKSKDEINDEETSGGSHTPRESLGNKSEEDIQFVADVKYDGNMSIELLVNLRVNYPSPNFITIPIKLHITDLAIHSVVCIAYLKRSIFFSFLCDIAEIPPGYLATSSTPHGETSLGGNLVDYILGPVNRDRIDIIKKIRIESEIGEAEQNVLRNVGKVEKFLAEQIKSIISEEVAWPNWLCFDFNDDDE